MRPSRLALAAASAAVALSLGAGPATAAVGWRFTPLQSGMVALDGTQSTGVAIIAPDGTETPVPNAYRVLGLTDAGRAFLTREVDVYGRTYPDGPAGEPRYTPLFPNLDVGFYAWLDKQGTPAPTTVGTSPMPSGGFYSGTAGERGWFDGSTFRLLDGPTVDGLVVDLPPNPQRAYISAWYATRMSGGGWVAGSAFDAWNWRTVVWRARPGATPATVLDTVQAEGFQEDRIATPYGVADDGTVLYRFSESGDDAVDQLRLGPGARIVASCTGGALPYGSIAADGTRIAYCAQPGVPQSTFTVTAPDRAWTYSGEPLFQPQALTGGLAAAYTGPLTALRGTLVVNGRLVDLERTFGAAFPATQPRVVSADRKGRLVVVGTARPPATGNAIYLAERRNPISVNVTTTGGAPAANVAVTVTEPGAVLRARRVVRTGRDGVARFEASGPSVAISIARGCLPGPRGCARSITVPLGILTTPAPIAALAGPGAATAPLMATVAQPARLVPAAGRIALPVRCLKASRCKGAATLRLKGLAAVAGSGRIAVAARKDGTVRITLTRAARARVARSPRGTVTLVVGGKRIVARVRLAAR